MPTQSFTVDGGTIASAQISDSRGTALWGVPVTNVSRIEVTKLPTPDLPATNTGGAINLVSKGGFERSKRLLTYNLYSAFRIDYPFTSDKVAAPLSPLISRSTVPSGEFTYMQPLNKSLAFSLSGSYVTSFFPTISGSPVWDLNTLILTNAQWGPTPQVVRNKNWQGGVDWKVGKNLFKFNYNRRFRESYQLGHTLSVNFGTGATGDATSTTGARTAVGSVSQSHSWLRFPSDVQLFTFSHRYSGEPWDVRTNASYSISESGLHTPRAAFYSVAGSLPNLVVTGKGLTGTGDNLKSVLPAVYTYNNINGIPVNGLDGNLYSLGTAGTIDQQYNRKNGQITLDVSRTLKTKIPIALKIGGLYSTNKYDTRNRSANYTFRPGTTASERVTYGLVDADYSVRSVPFVDGNRVNWISPVKVFSLFQARPDYFVLNESQLYTNTALTSKRLEQRIWAGYLRGDIDLFKDRLHIATGVRFEQTLDDGRGPLNDPAALFAKDANGKFALNEAGQRVLITTDPLQQAKLQIRTFGATSARDYNDLYPSFNARYTLTDKIVMRIGYARTLSRPDLGTVIPGVTFSPVTANPQTITVVNSGLTPWTANNYDLSLETYIYKGGSGSVGVFRKNIKDFFTSVSVRATPELLNSFGITPIPDVDYLVNTRANGGFAEINGSEFSYRQSLLFLPKWARGIQTWVSYTKLSLSGSTTSDFTGFNPETFSAGFSLTRPRFVIKFNVSMQGETKRAPVAASASIPASTYLWQGRKNRAFLSAEYQITKQIGIFGAIDDVIGGTYYDRQRRYADTRTPSYARYQRVQDWGQSGRFGVKGEF